MKLNSSLLTSCFLLLFLIGFSCKSTSDSTAKPTATSTTQKQTSNTTVAKKGDCIDRTKMQKRPCPRDYNPVCGCDGNTYNNACLADIAGVTRYTDGKCNDGCVDQTKICLLYTSPSPRDATLSRMPSSA